MKTKDEIAQAYDSPGWWYDLRGLFILTFAYNNHVLQQFRFFAPLMGPRHLEVGCGSGNLLGWILRWRRWVLRLAPPHITAVDYAESMLISARERFKDSPQVEVLHADAGSLPFADGQFDTASVANAYHCLPDVSAALAEIGRVLKPGGRFAANVLIRPRGPWPLNQFSQRIDDWGIRKGILFAVYEPSRVDQQLRAAGFQIERSYIVGNSYHVIARKPA